MTTWTTPTEPANTWSEDVATSDTWTSPTGPTNTWDEAEANVPKPGMQAGVVGDEWDELWGVDVDFTPWIRAGETTTPWIEG